MSDLRTVLGSSGFRKLYATRLISQTGDGVFNAGLGAYVFFNSASFPDRARVAFTECVGPFVVPDAGHFLQWEQADVLNRALARFCA